MFVFVEQTLSELDVGIVKIVIVFGMYFVALLAFTSGVLNAVTVDIDIP